MLTFILKKEWYEKIKKGQKTIEYREVKPYWSKRIYSELSKEFERRFNNKFYSYEVFITFSSFSVICEEDTKLKSKLRLGYTNKYMTAHIVKIEIVNGNNTDLHIDKPVYAIHFVLDKNEGTLA